MTDLFYSESFKKKDLFRKTTSSTYLKQICMWDTSTSYIIIRL